MKAVIMAGGFGTRLRPLTMNIPKPMVPMANKPMMDHIVDLLLDHGYDDILSLLYYHPEVIRTHFGDGSDFGITMNYVQAEADFGTAGSVRNAADKLGDEPFIIISGDVLTDFDLTAALEFHKSKGADATLVLTRVPNPLQFGVVITDDEGKITRFLEKPSWGEVFSDTVNTGIYILENHVLGMIPYREDFDFSKQLFPMMMQEGMKLYGYIAEGYWRDVGNLNEYQEASMDILSGDVKVKLGGKQHGRVHIGEGAEVKGDLSRFKGSAVIGANCRVAASANITNSIIGKNVTIFDGADISNSVIWDGCTIEENVQISTSVVAYDTILRSGSTVEDNVFISDECVIGTGATVRSNIKLWPKKVVEEGAILTKSLVWEDKWLRDLFTDARITGSANIEMNPEIGAKLGLSLGASLGPGATVVASRDPDNASRMLKRAITCGLMSAGVTIADMQASSIPLVRQELRSGKYMAGFHVRRSPFDKNSTDVIFFDGYGKDMMTGMTKNIERQFFAEDAKRADQGNLGSIIYPERSNEAYKERFLATLDTKLISSRGFNAVIDYSYGIAATLFPNILGAIGAQVVSLNAYVDPEKITRSSHEFKEACNHVSHIVTSVSYDLGFLIDAGAEKIFITNERGEFIPDSRILPIVTKAYLESQRLLGKPPQKIATPIAATAEVQLVAEEYDAEVVFTTNTHGGMMAAGLEDPDIQYIGGTRGGFIFPEFLFATDALYSVAKILELLSRTGWTLSDIDKMIPRLHRSQRDIYCEWNVKGSVMRQAMRDSEGMTRILIDGIKLVLGRGEWVLLLPSKESALFHVIVEAESPARVQELADEYEHKVVQWRDNL
jgi:mannose-1-phosphate guanylyltransferase / phosphomannomutase